MEYFAISIIDLEGMFAKQLINFTTYQDLFKTKLFSNIKEITKTFTNIVKFFLFFL